MLFLLYHYMVEYNLTMNSVIFKRKKNLYVFGSHNELSKREDGGSPNNGGSSEERTKATRHPRWTKNETLVLIEGKKATEDRIQFLKGRRSTAASGQNTIEPKWDLASSFCRQHDVNRGPVQCRKRWSNLLVDFKKIKNWESKIDGEAESFWVMKNDLRKEKKLPGFFDREVYDHLGNDATTTPATPLAVMCPMPLSSMPMEDVIHETTEAAAEEEEEQQESEEEHEKISTSIQNESIEDGLISDFEESGQEESVPNSKEQKVTESPTKTFTTHVSTPDPIKGKRGLGSDTRKGCVSRYKQKLRRLSREGCESNLPDQLIRVMEKNSKMVTAQLKAQNENSQLEREQNNLLAAIKGITDALVRIADKLSTEKP